MKKLLIFCLCAVTCISLIACGSDEKESQETAKKTDWRNTIEYEGSFFVNEQLKLLYALDTGSITLWDNAGKGEILQVVEYDTAVADAIERIEKDDFNGDGNCDIRIIYSESDAGTKYTLWLWSEKSEKFAECRLYATLTDPTFDEATGNVIGVDDLGVFGTVTKVYAFNDTLGLDEVSITISDPEAIATDVASATVGGTLRPAEGKTSVDDVECAVFVASEGGKDIAYIAHTPDSVWYIDEGCRGFYRILEEQDGAITPGKYAGAAGVAAQLCEKITKKSVDIIASVNGNINGTAGICYTAKTEDLTTVYLVNGDNGYWYFSENGESYKLVSTQSGEAVGEDEYGFALPEKE